MDTLTGLQQPHFHLGSHVTQVYCCCFSPEGSTILSGSADKTLKLWRTRDGSFSSTLSGEACLYRDIEVLNIPTLVERDVCFFLQTESGVPLSETTKNVLEMLCDPSDRSFSIRSAALHFAFSELDTFFCSSSAQVDALLKEYDELKCDVKAANQEVNEQVADVTRIRSQLGEAEKKLASARQKHETLVAKKTKSRAQRKIATVKTEELRMSRDFYKGELDKTRSVMNQLSSKLKKHRCVSCLTQEEVLLFLQELDIPKSIRDSFKKNQVGGKALKLISDRNLRELGMSDINQRKGLLHSICNVRVHGCIHVAPPVGACCGDGLAAWWSADEVWKWLEEQGFSFPSLKGLTGRTLIHLSDEDISQFGLPMGPALELKEKCETLKQSFFSFVHQQRE